MEVLVMISSQVHKLFFMNRLTQLMSIFITNQPVALGMVVMLLLEFRTFLEQLRLHLQTETQVFGMRQMNFGDLLPH